MWKLFIDYTTLIWSYFFTYRLRAFFHGYSSKDSLDRCIDNVCMFPTEDNLYLLTDAAMALKVDPNTLDTTDEVRNWSTSTIWVHLKKKKLYFVALFVLFPAEEKNFKVWGQFFPVIAITKNEPREQFCRPRPKAEAGNGSRGSFFCDQDNWKKLSETWKFIYEAAWNRKNQCNRVLFCIFPIIIEKNFSGLGEKNFSGLGQKNFLPKNSNWVPPPSSIRACQGLSEEECWKKFEKYSKS